MGAKIHTRFFFFSPAKSHKEFSNINDIVKSSLQKWILYHPHVIQSTISNCFIKVKIDDGNGRSKTELRQKVLFQVSVRELHINTLKKYSTGFSMVYYEKGLVRIIDSDV